MSDLQKAKEHYYDYIARWGSGKYSANYIKELEYELERQKTVINELLFEKESSK